jgi:hypothetical protein
MNLHNEGTSILFTSAPSSIDALTLLKGCVSENISISCNSIMQTLTPLVSAVNKWRFVPSENVLDES